MAVEPSLRERKKRQTRTTLWNTAIELFVEHGFDNVSVAQIAAAADVSKMTVFNYFPTKEDLVIGPMTEHIDEPARVVRDRAAGESAVTAIRRQFIEALGNRDPATGLTDLPNVLAVQRLVRSTPSLAQRAYWALSRTEELLAAELAVQTGESFPVTARLAAALILATRHSLIFENCRRLLGGEKADEVYPGAVRAAELAFDLLEHGLGNYPVRES